LAFVLVLVAEVLNHADTEAVLRFKPERVGHACYLDKYAVTMQFAVVAASSVS
jgi:hypothetical protein